jgi:excisionase family DNA binding protein
MSENKSDGWVSMTVMCKYVNASRDTIKKWIATKGMPASRIGKLWKFKISLVDEWIMSGGAADEVNDPKERWKHE